MSSNKKIAESGTCTLNTDSRLSDHKATYISLKLHYYVTHEYQRKVWQKKNNKLNLLTKTFDWKFLLCRKRLREFYDGILKIGAGILKKETITIRPNDKPWFYSLLRKFIRIQNGLHNKALGSKFLEKFDVLLLFKKGDPSVKSNYKPVSLSSCVSKIMETFHQ